MRSRPALWYAIALSLVLFAYLTRGVYAQRPTASLVLYDSFNERFLDPSRWSLYGGCFTWSVLECVREIQQDSLRLAVRSYGATNSNVGNAYGQSEVHFVNPAPIRRIATTLTVRQASAASCPANGDTQSMQTLIKGNFFNSGSAAVEDDVQAFLVIAHTSTDPQGQLTALGFLHWKDQFFGNISFGNLSVGQTVVAQLSWDQPNHQFLVSWTDVETGRTTRGSMPYEIQDTTPAAAPDKVLGVATFAPNCVGPQMLAAYGETRFHNVWIGK